MIFQHLEGVDRVGAVLEAGGDVRLRIVEPTSDTRAGGGPAPRRSSAHSVRPKWSSRMPLARLPWPAQPDSRSTAWSTMSTTKRRRQAVVTRGLRSRPPTAYDGSIHECRALYRRGVP